MKILILIYLLQLTNIDPEKILFATLQIEINSPQYEKFPINLNQLGKGEEYDAELIYYFDKSQYLKKFEMEFYRTMYKSKCIYYLLNNNIVLSLNKHYVYNMPFNKKDWKIIDTLTSYEIWNFTNNKIKILESKSDLQASENLKNSFLEYINYKKYLKFKHKK